MSNSSNPARKRVLFVCLGNICRSPAAEAIFRSKVIEKGEDLIDEIDSAGLNGYHNGEMADSRMIRAAKRRGYNITSISRKFNPDIDFDKFDLIIGMDDFNIKELRKLAKRAGEISKISKMTDFADGKSYGEVPDPYYGGDDGFDKVLDILENCSDGLIAKLRL
jgi:protein-tyrosine phosphatase